MRRGKSLFTTEGNLHPQTVAEALDIEEAEAAQALRLMRERGAVTHLGHGHYTIVSPTKALRFALETLTDADIDADDLMADYRGTNLK